MLPARRVPVDGAERTQLKHERPRTYEGGVQASVPGHPAAGDEWSVQGERGCGERW